MLALGVVAVSILWGVIRGGHVSQLAKLELQGLWFYFLALAVQVLFVSNNLAPGPYRGLFYMVSFGLLLVGAWLDRGTPATALLAGGFFANALVIAVNGGRMPVLAPNLMMQASGLQALKHSSITPATRLWPLGDILRLPLWGDHFMLLSPGDILLAIGLFLLIQRQMAPR